MSKVVWWFDTGITKVRAPLYTKIAYLFFKLRLFKSLMSVLRGVSCRGHSAMAGSPLHNPPLDWATATLRAPPFACQPFLGLALLSCAWSQWIQLPIITIKKKRIITKNQNQELEVKLWRHCNKCWELILKKLINKKTLMLPIDLLVAWVMFKHNMLIILFYATQNGAC